MEIVTAGNKMLILDANGKQIEIGSVVNTSGEVEFENLSQEERERVTKRWSAHDRERFIGETFKRGKDGVVQEISDWDGDVDDDTMRSISIPPKVGVKWPGLEQLEWFPTTPINNECDELEVDDLVLIENAS